MDNDRAIRWMDRIPVLWMIGAAIVGAIVWIVTINMDVKQNKADSDRFKASSDGRSEKRNAEMKDITDRILKIETWQDCVKHGGCERIGRDR